MVQKINASHPINHLTILSREIWKSFSSPMILRGKGIKNKHVCSSRANKRFENENNM
jgi:hypothetical protein